MKQLHDLTFIFGGDNHLAHLNYQAYCEINPAMSLEDRNVLSSQTGIPAHIIQTAYEQSCAKNTCLKLSVDLTYSLSELSDSDEIYEQFNSEHPLYKNYY